MKKSIFSFGTLLLLSAIFWSCSDSPENNLEENLSLVQLMEVKANSLTDAVIDISESKGFEIITIDDGTNLKNGTDNNFRFPMNIELDDIKGIYDYKKGVNDSQGTVKSRYRKVFEKLDESELFILRLPKEKAMSPLELYVNENAEYANDFIITTTEYNYIYSQGLKFDYLLNCEIEIEDEKAGELFVDWSISEKMNFDYVSKFTFTDDYSVGIEFEFGDMFNAEFNLKKGDDILFKEEIEITKSDDTNNDEIKYSLILGNIKIVLNTEFDTYLVYRNDILQEGATIEVVKHKYNLGDAHVAFCRKGRNIKITFENGTSIELSELLSEDTLELMDKTFSSMYNMKFVKHIVDKIATEVYYTNFVSSTRD